MKPTQNKKRVPGWKEPEPGSTQKFITPGAEKSLREGAGRYRAIKAPSAPSKKRPPAQRQNAAGAKGGAKAPARGPQSFSEALKAELADRLKIARMNISVDSEDIIKGCIIAGYTILFILLQTTLFSKLRPFGAVPDLMLAFCVAVAQNEGEKWGGVCGLISAFCVTAMGSLDATPHLLPLLYASLGYGVGILSGYYFNDSIPVKAMYIAGSGILRAAASYFCAAAVLDASVGQIFKDIIIPEFFSTAAMAPFVYFIIHISLKHFHKTRAQRTENNGELY